jgi:hypothetical protein
MAIASACEVRGEEDFGAGRRRRKKWMRDEADDISGTGGSRDRWDGIENATCLQRSP